MHLKLSVGNQVKRLLKSVRWFIICWKSHRLVQGFFYCFLFAWCSFSEFALFVSEGMGLYVGRLVWKTSTTQNAENEQFSKLTLNRVNYFNKCHFVVLRFVGGFYLHISHNNTVLLTKKVFFFLIFIIK